MVKPIVRLHDAGLGLIIPWPSGVIYSNQTCGHICMQPEVEGVFIPFDADEIWEQLALYFEGPKYSGSGAMTGLDEADADLIDRLLAELRQAIMFTDRRRLSDSHEGWVQVVISVEVEWSLFSGFGPYPREAILTWPSSD